MSRKLTAALAAVCATGVVAVAGPALAQSGSTSIEVKKVQVSPNKAGTKKKPRAVKLTVNAKIKHADTSNRSIVQSIRILFPKGSLYNGAKLPKCSQADLSNGEIPAKCKKAVMGSGKANAWADTTRTVAKITVVNGGANAVYFFTEMDNPAVVRTPAPGKIKKLSGKWAYQLDVTIPEELQVVGGVPIAIEDLAVKAGKGNWLATTSCPKSKKWPFEVTANYVDQATFSERGSTKYASFTRCR